MQKIFLCIALMLCSVVSAQDASVTDSLASVVEPTKEQPSNELNKYRRSSLYSVLIKHSTFKFGEAIDSAFMTIPIPEKFNDHNLHVRALESSALKQKKSGKDKESSNEKDITAFIDNHHIGKYIVAKWFNRDSLTGALDMSLIQKRGHYDAAQADINLADKSAFGRAMLADAGEDLIGKTFMMVNDITFIDKGERSAKVGGFMKMFGAIAGAAAGVDVSGITDTAAAAVNEIDGFTVNITSYLYRLDWNTDIAGQFYTEYWADQTTLDEQKRAAFDNSELFKMSYVGATTTSAANMSSKSFSKKSKEDQMLKVCTRAVDKAIVELQRAYDEFKVNTPLHSINEDGTVNVHIGLKEGINEKSEFDVLMPVEVDGKTVYEKVGKIAPIVGKIWDNRFGADEDAAALAADGKKNKNDDGVGDANLTATTFKVLSGANKIMPGCLVREVTIKAVKK